MLLFGVDGGGEDSIRSEDFIDNSGEEIERGDNNSSGSSYTYTTTTTTTTTTSNVKALPLELDDEEESEGPLPACFTVVSIISILPFVSMVLLSLR